MTWLLATYLVRVWSVGHPIVIMIYILAILMAGTLIGARAGVTVTTVTAITGLALIWSDDVIEFDVVIGFVAIIALVGLVSWLSNRQMRMALTRAHASEAALKKERDSLEQTVAERTLELQRFAEFGRLTGSLLHDLASPLTTAALSLQLLNDRQRSRLARAASRNITCLERYVMAAQRQLQQEGQIRRFSVSAELKQVLHILNHRARISHVSVTVTAHRVYLNGDPVKFNHLATNLIANAIDAYDGLNLPLGQATINVEVEKHSNAVILRVTDHGSGITRPALERVFEPFFTTKASDGTGIGLSITKRIVEDDFGGSLEVTSSAASGTVFTARLDSSIRFVEPSRFSKSN